MAHKKLIDYLPPVLQEIMEFMAINEAMQPEITDAWAALQRVMNNQFIDTATEDGVEMWETELDITPPATDTLDQRKERIKSFWVYGVVYTYNWLVGWLKASCEGRRTQLPVVTDYTLKVSLPISVDYVSLLESMRRYISANILIDPTILLTAPVLNLYTGAAFRTGIKQDVKSTGWDGKRKDDPDDPSDWDLDGISMLADEAGTVLLEDAGNLVLFEEVTS